MCQMEVSKGLCLIMMLVILVQIAHAKECIKTKLGRPCQKNEDCHGESEFHLYCNKTKRANVCAFHLNTYIGHAARDLACDGPEFSAEPWTNPIPNGLIALGMDCMRMCLHVHTCFGIGLQDKKCYLKNEKCFTHLKRKKGALISVLNVVREDYRCGCHYPFTRMTSEKQTLTWSPDCPESQLTRSPYRCCTDKGLCSTCPGNGTENAPSGDHDQTGYYRLK